MRTGFLAVVSWALLAAAPGAVLPPAAAGAGGGAMLPPDRSILWESHEALSHVQPGAPGRQAYGDTAYGYDVLHMDLELFLYVEAESIAGTATMDVEVESAGLAEIRIDLTDSLVVDSVSVDGLARPFTHGADKIAVALAGPADAGSTLGVAASYHGHPPEVGNKGIVFDAQPSAPLVWVLSTPYSNLVETVLPVSSYWRPCKDMPDDKSTFALTITVPDSLVACSNGLMKSNVDNGDGTRTFRWEHDYPVSPYLVAFGVTDYMTIEETYVGSGDSALVQHFVYPHLYTSALEAYNVTIPAIEYLASIFGEYPFMGEKFGTYNVDGGVAVEEQTLVALPGYVVDPSHYYDWLFVHEMAHMWWGDCVTCRDWKHVWLNEGFASYTEALWTGHAQGAAWFRIYMDGMENPPYMGTVYDPPYVWDRIVYEKGAWIVHMLRWVLGDEDFFQLLLDYRAAHEYGSATTDDLKAAAEALCGSHLDWFFDQWVYAEGEPDYEFWWEYTGTGPYTVYVYVQQVQSPSLPTFKMPLRVRINTTGEVESYTVMDSLRTQGFEFTVAAQPTSVVPDPKNKILGDFTEVSPGASVGAGSRTALMAWSTPNPFTISTVVRVALPGSQQASVRIFDVAGRAVRTLADGRFDEGDHSLVWDGTDDAGRPLAAGVYFCRMSSESGSVQSRIVLLR